jgi:hypothetical protein
MANLFISDVSNCIATLLCIRKKSYENMHVHQKKLREKCGEGMTDKEEQTGGGGGNAYLMDRGINGDQYCCICTCFVILSVDLH